MDSIVADSSVWIDILTDRDTVQTRMFERLIELEHTVLLGDLALVKILQGTRNAGHLAQTLSRLALFDQFTICDGQVAVEAAHHYQILRARGVTPRKTIDTLIATRCIVNDLPLLYSDRDFDPFVEHLGLRSALDLPIGTE